MYAPIYWLLRSLKGFNKSIVFNDHRSIVGRYHGYVSEAGSRWLNGCKETILAIKLIFSS